jgi:hypothetical protein
MRDAPMHPLSAGRRKTLLLRFGRTASQRLLRLRDPDVAILEAM